METPYAEQLVRQHADHLARFDRDPRVRDLVEALEQLLQASRQGRADREAIAELQGRLAEVWAWPP